MIPYEDPRLGKIQMDMMPVIDFFLEHHNAKSTDFRVRTSSDRVYFYWGEEDPDHLCDYAMVELTRIGDPQDNFWRCYVIMEEYEMVNDDKDDIRHLYEVKFRGRLSMYYRYEYNSRPLAEFIKKFPLLEKGQAPAS